MTRRHEADTEGEVRKRWLDSFAVLNGWHDRAEMAAAIRRCRLILERPRTREDREREIEKALRGKYAG